MANAGSAQNGWIILVQASPQAIAMAVFAASTPSAAPAGIIMGACTAHCPPPEGTKKLTIPALQKVNSGNVVSLETETKACEITPAKDAPSGPTAVIMPMMPA